MRIFVSAAEISSDIQAEKILRELIKLFPGESIEVAGIGGPKLRSIPHFSVIENAENLRSMGFTEILSKLLFFRRILKRTVKFLEAFQPDLMITFDYPEFHFALLKACRAIPSLRKTFKVCGIPPKVWVWRMHRLQVIQKLYDLVWVLFPFEKSLYENVNIPVIFEGNPLIADLFANPVPSKQEWNLESEIRLAVFPGSRDAEVKAHVRFLPETLERLSLKCKKKIIAEVSVPEGLSIEGLRKTLIDTRYVNYLISQGASRKILSRNAIGLIKSGTGSLEAACLGCVPVIFYQVSFITRLIVKHIIRYQGAVGLPNILLGVKNRRDAIFPELLGVEANPEALSIELYKLIQDPDLLKSKQQLGFSLRKLMVPQENISLQVALRIKEALSRPVIRGIQREKKYWIQMLSFLWSTLNWMRRLLYRARIFKTHEVTLPSILVGNLQAGGAGKTPLVIVLAQEAVKRGFKVGVVSRGYGARLQSPYLLVNHSLNSELINRPDRIGDEPCELIAAVPELTLGLGKNRVKLACELQAIGINFLIFDDGFQNLKFKASKTLLVVTDARPSEVVFRDFFSAAKMADAIYQTKGWPIQAPIESKVLEWEVDSLPEGPVWLLCGVADSLEVAQFYENLGVKIEKVISLPDHAHFDLAKMREYQVQAKECGAQIAVTPKDWVKIRSDSSLTFFVLKRKIRSEDWLELAFKS